MKICEKGGLYMQVMKDGYCRPCEFQIDPEQAKEFGCLQDSSLHEIYHSTQACKLRNQIVNGRNFTYCRKDVCRYIAKQDASILREIDNIPYYPETLNLAYDYTCNYHCKCCTFHSQKQSSPEVIKKIEDELRKALPYTKHIITNGCGEFFASKSIMTMLEEWKPVYNPKECSLTLYTNGSLFDEEHWKKIEKLSNIKINVHVTLYSYNEKTYQFISGTELPIQRVKNNLKFIHNLREENKINYFELATVVQERNFRELPEFVRYSLDEYNPDCIRIRGYEPWGAMDKNIEWFFNVRNPEHPYYEEYCEMMKDPIFKHPQVFNWMGYSDSRQGVIPAVASYDILRTWLRADNVQERIHNYLSKNKLDGIVLYGISEMADILYRQLMQFEIKVECIVDKFSPLQTWNGLCVKKPSAEFYGEIANYGLLVCLFNKEKFIVEEIIKDGFIGTIVDIHRMLKEDL